LYMESTSFIVHIGRIAQFVDAFFPSGATGGLENAHGNFGVIVSPDELSNMDVTGLLQLRARAPEVDFEFQDLILLPGEWPDESHHGRVRVLNMVLFPHKDTVRLNGGRLKPLASLISRIELSYGLNPRAPTRSTWDATTREWRLVTEPWDTRIKIWFKKSAAEPWMDGKARVTGLAIREPETTQSLDMFSELIEHIDIADGRYTWYITPFVEE